MSGELSAFWTDMAEESVRMAETLARVEALAEKWEEARFYDVAAMQLRNSFTSDLRAILEDQ